MWWCEDYLNRKTAHFRLSSVAQKRCMLKLTTSGLSCSKGGEQLDNSTCFVSIHPLDSSIHPLSNWALVKKKRKKRILSDDPILT